MKCKKCGIQVGDWGKDFHNCEERVRARETELDQFLYSLGYDYHDTESSARYVAEKSLARIKELEAEINRLNSLIGYT